MKLPLDFSFVKWPLEDNRVYNKMDNIEGKRNKTMGKRLSKYKGTHYTKNII